MSTNQYRKAGHDFATQLKHDIEYNRQGARTGWIVQLMSIGQGNITHADEFNLMNIMMGEKDKRLPIDQTGTEGLLVFAYIWLSSVQ